MPSRIIKSPTGTLQLKVSFKDDLREKIIASAEKAHRSMTAEVIYRLEQSFELQENQPAFDFSNPVQDLITWRYMAHDSEYAAEILKDDEDLKSIFEHFVEIIMEGTEEESEQLLGRFLAKKLRMEVEVKAAETLKEKRELRRKFEQDAELDLPKKKK